jgi:hypothetical protein
VALKMTEPEIFETPIAPGESIVDVVERMCAR